MIPVRALAPPLLTASVLAAVASGVLLLLLPIEGLAVGGLIGGFALPGMLSVGSATTPVLGAMLVARVGHKPVMIGGLLLCALSIALMASGGRPDPGCRSDAPRCSRPLRAKRGA